MKTAKSTCTISFFVLKMIEFRKTGNVN